MCMFSVMLITSSVHLRHRVCWNRQGRLSLPIFFFFLKSTISSLVLLMLMLSEYFAMAFSPCVGSQSYCRCTVWKGGGQAHDLWYATSVENVWLPIQTIRCLFAQYPYAKCCNHSGYFQGCLLSFKMPDVRKMSTCCKVNINDRWNHFSRWGTWQRRIFTRKPSLHSWK